MLALIILFWKVGRVMFHRRLYIAQLVSWIKRDFRLILLQHLLRH